MTVNNDWGRKLTRRTNFTILINSPIHDRHKIKIENPMKWDLQLGYTLDADSESVARSLEQRNSKKFQNEAASWKGVSNRYHCLSKMANLSLHDSQIRNHYFGNACLNFFTMIDKKSHGLIAFVRSLMESIWIATARMDWTQWGLCTN